VADSTEQTRCNGLVGQQHELFDQLMGCRSYLLDSRHTPCSSSGSSSPEIQFQRASFEPAAGWRCEALACGHLFDGTRRRAANLKTSGS
jgi:hypothetical protein